MNCSGCGAEMAPDAQFCARCRAEVRADEVVPPRGNEAAPDRPTETANAKATGLRTLGIVGVVLALVLGVAWLAYPPGAEPEVVEVPEPAPAPLDEPAASPNPTVIRQAAPQRPPTESERALAGTWVARSAPAAPRRTSFRGNVVELPEELARTGRFAQLPSCMWLELYPNLRGFQNDCAIVNGEPTALGQMDDRHTAVGVAFSWSFDDRRLSITYDEEMTYAVASGPVRYIRTVLVVPTGHPPFDVQQSFEVQQSFPQHPRIAALTHRFNVATGTYPGDDAADESAGEAP